MSRSVALLLVALTIALLIVNVALLRQNSRLKAALERAQRSFAPTVGALVPSLIGVDMQGVARTIGYGDDARDTLVFIFSPDCGASARAWPQWLDLARRADSTAVRLVYANVGSKVPAGHVARTGDLKGATVVETDARSKVDYNLRLTPQILRITAAARIAEVWLGRLDPDEERTLHEALGIGRRQALSTARP
jgi:hypothetical protein